MHWHVADKDYVNYLRSFEPLIEEITYKNRLKPYIGVVLSINNFNYYIPISSAKPKHKKMKNSRDFLKLIDDTQELIAVLNINNMIPIPLEYISRLDYSKIELYRLFANNIEREQYIDLLRKELKIINSMSNKIQKNAEYLYEHKVNYLNDSLSNRCCNFILLEDKAIEYQYGVNKVDMPSKDVG